MQSCLPGCKTAQRRVVAALFKEKLLLGQYYPADSAVHRLHAACKIIVTLLYMVTLLVVDSWAAWGFLTLLCIICVALSKVPLITVWRGTQIIAVFALFTWLLNLFLFPGEQVLWQWKFLTITMESLTHGAAMALRLVLLVVFASLMTLTTRPIELTDGLERLLKPFTRVGIPAHEIAMIMSIALRFIPTLLDELERIMLAQRARGADLGQGSLLRRIKAFIPLLVPLFVSAFRRAEDLAQAMEAKCYTGGAGRTRWKEMPWRAADTVVLVFFLLLLAAGIVQKVVL